VLWIDEELEKKEAQQAHNVPTIGPPIEHITAFDSSPTSMFGLDHHGALYPGGQQCRLASYPVTDNNITYTTERPNETR
jgi:hypothetical protein